MEDYLYKTPENFKLIKGMFLIIAVAMAVGLTLFFTLSIHESAQSTDGIIYSRNSPHQYLAPHEATLMNVFVEEGQNVKKGDTLIILNSVKLNDEYKLNEQKLAEAITNLGILEKQLTNLEKKKYRQNREINLLNQKQKSTEKTKGYEKDAMQQQVAALEEKVNIAKKRIQKDKQLFERGAISEKEYSVRYQRFLDESNVLSKMKAQAFTLTNEDLDAQFKTESSQQKLKILSTESQALKLEQVINKEKFMVEQLEAKLASLDNERQKLLIIADSDGYVTNLFNTKNDLNFISKNKPLATLTPNEKETFYAKLALRQQELKDIKIGQKVHLKVDAYNHFQHGVIFGEVVQIDVTTGSPGGGGGSSSSSSSKSKEGGSNQGFFYVLADLKQDPESSIQIQRGLKTKGEIIIEKVKVYQFVTSKLFKKL